MGAENGHDKVIQAPPAVARLAHPSPGVADVEALARAQGMTMAPEDVIAAQQAQIRELQGKLVGQELAASTFANIICCMAAMFQHGMDAVGGAVDFDAGHVTVTRGLIDRMDGAKVALEETGDRDIKVTITERMD